MKKISFSKKLLLIKEGLIIGMFVVILGFLIINFTKGHTNKYVHIRINELHENWVDMRQVIDFEVTEKGLQLYLTNNENYYWEK